MEEVILSPEEIWQNAQQFWASDALSIEDAIQSDLVPVVLKRVLPNNAEQKIRATRMYVARFIGMKMQTQSISDEQMGNFLKAHESLFSLCKFIKETNLEAHWIQTQAPLYVGDNIQVKWQELGNRRRIPLETVIARAISLGAVWNNTGTDYFVFSTPQKQLRAFIWFCNEIAKGNVVAMVDSRMRKQIPKDY